MKKFRVLFTLLIAVALVFTLSACGGTDEPSGDNGGGDKGPVEKTYVVGTDAAYAPMEYMDGNDIVGFDIDLIKAAAKAAGIKIDIKHTGWDPLFAGLDNGSIDLGISSITITDERKKIYDFTNPYFDSNQLIMVREDSTVEKLLDLEGKNIGVQVATTGNFVVADAFGETYAGIKAYDDAPSAVDDLMLGRLDAVVIDKPVLENILKVVAKEGYRLIQDPDFEIEQYGIIALKNRDDGVIEKMNEGLAAIKADGTLDQIFNKYFAE